MSNQVVYLTKKDVPAIFRQHYHGNTFKAVITDSVTVPSDSGLWDGGSRDIHAVVDIFNGDHKPVPHVSASPWSGRRQEIKIDLISGYAVVETSIFQGKDCGRTIYISPANAAALLPAPAVELTDDERFVLKGTRQYKASYNGKDRYQLSIEGTLSSEPVISRERWDAAKASLIAAGYLNKAGALTIKGKNAAQ